MLFVFTTANQITASSFTRPVTVLGRLHADFCFINENIFSAYPDKVSNKAMFQHYDLKKYNFPSYVLIKEQFAMYNLIPIIRLHLDIRTTVFANDAENSFAIFDRPDVETFRQEQPPF